MLKKKMMMNQDSSLARRIKRKRLSMNRMKKIALKRMRKFRRAIWAQGKRARMGPSKRPEEMRMMMMTLMTCFDN